jgi:multidrug efflux system outer membrane protein
MQALEEVFAETMPREMGYDYIGISFQEKQAQQGVPPTAIFGLSLLFVFLILAAQYESWSLPFSVLLGTPIAALGAFATLYLRRMDNDTFAQIGLVMLIGLAAKNAILIVEFAKAELGRGRGIIEAALTGARLRLRPIVMTAFAFMLGCVPLWTAEGAGAVSRRVLGSTVIGGMLAATCIAVFIVPLCFYGVERLSHRGKGREGPPPPAPPPGAAGAAAVALLLAMTLGGCALGPDYERPKIEAPPAFRSADGAGATAASLADIPWWDVFRDDRLAALVREALADNYDARIAAARIEQARAGIWIARADLFPHAGYEAVASRGLNTFAGEPFPTGATSAGPSFLGALNATWEIDVWGRIRRQTEAARAELLASAEGRRAVWLTLVSDVGRAYFQLLELDKELEIARRSTASFGESLRIFDEKLKGGVGSKLETSRAEGALAGAAATIPSLEREIAAQENELNLLLGRGPGPVSRTATLLGIKPPPEVPAGLPSSLLERRPDVLAVEQQLVAANAAIGAALANFFPKFGLSAIAGAASVQLADIAKGPGGLWSVAASATGPLFEGGALVGRYDQAKALRLEGALRYQETVLGAFRDVSNALIANAKLREVEVQQAHAAAALEEAVTVSTQRYQAGQSSYYEVLEAQQQLFPAQTALARIQRDRLLAIVQLYKALGGGWKLDDEAFAGRKEAAR